MRHILPAFIVALALAGCTTQQVDLRYQDTHTYDVDTSDLTSVQMGDVEDERGHGTNWLGAIRGGFGQPLKTLETDGPVKNVVRKAYADALKSREIYTEREDAPRLRVVMDQFDCNQYVRREAHVKFNVQLISADDGAVIFQDRVEVDTVQGSLVSLDTGLFASVEELREVAHETLQKAVDQTLNDPDFRRAIRKTSVDNEV
mgnify:FL=1